MLVCAHSIDYLLNVTSVMADILFEDLYKFGLLFLFKFVFVYVVYYLFKQLPLTRKIYNIT